MIYARSQFSSRPDNSIADGLTKRKIQQSDRQFKVSYIGLIESSVCHFIVLCLYINLIPNFKCF